MKPVSEHEIRLFRLRRHRLDAHRVRESVLEAAGPADYRTHRPVLYFLGMGFDELLEDLVSVIPVLDYQTVRGKAALDSLLAGAMLPLIPAAKRGLWKSPSSTAGLRHRRSAGRPCPSCCAPAP